MRSTAAFLLAIVLTFTVAIDVNAQNTESIWLTVNTTNQLLQRNDLPIGPYVSTTVTPVGVNVGQTAAATVRLDNVPTEGYISAEFTCTYNSALVQVSNINVTGLFGADPAIAINDPQNGSFIVGVAGSNGNKATASGDVFIFSAKGLQAGQAALDCTARISRGDNILTDLPSTGAASLTIVDDGTITPTPTGSVTPTFTETSTPTGSVTPPTETPTGSTTPISTETFTPTGSPTSTLTETPTPTDTTTPPTDTATPSLTATASASPTPTEQPPGTLTGRVIACKPVTVTLWDGGPGPLQYVDANPDGTFTVTVPAGGYIVDADAAGFLSARAGTIDVLNETINPVVIIASGATTTMQTITLLAGDLFKLDYLLGGVIDEWDAMSIGMNYGEAGPAAADLNCDGIIDVLDLELLAANYRKTGPTPWEVSSP